MTIKSEITIDLPLKDSMSLMAEPGSSKHWMHDLVLTEQVPNGDSKLTFKNGMIFTLSPLPVQNSNELRSTLKNKSLNIVTVAKFSQLTPHKTRLSFVQEFTFNGFGRFISFALKNSIKKQQQQHMLGFKQFAETNKLK